MGPSIDSAALLGEEPELRGGRRDLPHAEVARIVHDFQTPLSTILLEAELLGHKLAHGLPADPAKSLARVARNAEYLARMVADLLDLCSFETGHLELRCEVLELGTLLAAVVERVISSRDADRITLELGAPVTARVDEHRLQRVIANLLENAIKYAPPASQIIVRMEPRATELEISVLDTGGGLLPAELVTMFDEYKRVGNLSLHAGSGLGLFVSKLIIAAHGGAIAVESAIGSGTRFYFTLPR